VELGEVENALRSHPDVGEAVVIARRAAGDKQLIAFVTAAGRPADAPPAATESASEDGHVDSWQSYYDSAYGQLRSGSRRDDFVGWDSSYDGQPIPKDEMRAWLDETIDRVQQLAPRRVLEIGCGGGLVLFRLAPGCERYSACDFSPSVIDAVRRELDEPGRGITGVELFVARADHAAAATTGPFDLVILNSVVQYFPSVDYFEQVLASVLPLVAPGGAIFLGDLRHAGLERLFHTSVALARASAEDSAAEVLGEIDALAARERELLLDPAIATALAARHRRIVGAYARPKRNPADNELSRFRYDMVLTLDSPGEVAPSTAFWDWDDRTSDLAHIAARLRAETPASVVLRGVPNRRLDPFGAALSALEQADPDHPYAALRAELSRRADRGADPDQLWRLADALPYRVDVRWTAGDRRGRLDILFTATDGNQTDGAAAVPAWPDERQPTGTYGQALREFASEPAARSRLSALGEAAQDHVAERLPSYMIPARVIA
ncbi:MAG: methyltransferase, partial [Myxococcota bacterium]